MQRLWLKKAILRFGMFSVLAITFIACDRSKAFPTLYPVTGIVMVEDVPVTAGVVSFRPDASRGNRTMHQPTGMINHDGSFELLTAGRKGAPTGWYRVLIIADNFQEADPPRTEIWPKVPDDYKPKTLVNSRYLYFNETDVLVEVQENPRPDQYVLRLKP